MSVPNKITLFRIILIPILLLFMFAPKFILLYVSYKICKYIALILFLIASISDFVDGYIARKYNGTTIFGKFMDPLADKILICSSLICLLDKNIVPAWIVIIFIIREFIINGVRLISKTQKNVIAASMVGKLKTTSQMIMISCFILNFKGIIINIGYIFMYISLILSIFSLVEYFYLNKNDVFNQY